PNILLITGDEWRADALGCAGNPVVQTPNIDRLAARGVRFENAYSPAPMCVPTRVSILTGQVPRAHGCITNGIVPSDNRTIVELLREAGYRTGAFGKMHFVPIYADLGFDTMQLAEQHGAGWQIDEYHRWLYEEYGMVDWIDVWDQVSDFRAKAPDWFHETYGVLKSPIPEEAYHTNWITDRFVDWIGTNEATEPWFAWVSYIKPHHPFDPPGKYADMYDPADIPLPPKDDRSNKPLLAGFDPKRAHYDISAWTDDDIRRMTALYYGNITLIDDCIGRMMEALTASGDADTTVVIVTSDHGDFLGHRGLITKTPFVLYEDTIRVPLVIADPTIDTPCRVRDAFVNLIDLFPTIAKRTGIQHDHRIHGHDLGPVIRGEVGYTSQIAVSETSGQIAIRKGDWKLIQTRDGKAELYNLEDDPYEIRNRMPELRDSAIVADLRARALEYVLSTEWDRLKRDTDGVQVIVDDEAKKLGRGKLCINPNAWCDQWPEEFTPKKRTS
ncbi:MAG TPA: hypothetical protein ENN56_00215, partial [Firmicutes bacterium]|nr:hypothetical protein [Bacillota bacterium]